MTIRIIKRINNYPLRSITAIILSGEKLEAEQVSGKHDVINNRIPRGDVLFLRVRWVFVADITRVVRKKMLAAFGSITSQESTRYVPYDRMSSVLYTSGVRNKRAELIGNLGHARVESFVVTCQFALALNHNFG